MFELDRWILVPRGNGATCFGRLKGEVKERSDVPYIYIEYVRFVIEIMMLS